jgi:hypothetical protein
VDNPDDGSKFESRPPTVRDLLSLCRELNKHQARYIVIEGMAIISAGFTRATEDIELLVDAAPENQERLRAALLSLPDQAVRDVAPDDLGKYAVVRVADEFVIDLMKSAGGMQYDQARPLVEMKNVDGVEIPFASAELLWKLKQTGRAKDALDLLFLKELLRK